MQDMRTDTGPVVEYLLQADIIPEIVKMGFANACFASLLLITYVAHLLLLLT